MLIQVVILLNKKSLLFMLLLLLIQNNNILKLSSSFPIITSNIKTTNIKNIFINDINIVTTRKTRRTTTITTYPFCTTTRSSSSSSSTISSTIMASSSSSSSSTTNDDIVGKQKQKPLYWNRELSKFGSYNDNTDTLIKDANIVCLSNKKDPANVYLFNKDNLPKNCNLLQIGETINDFDINALNNAKCNVMFVSHPKSKENIIPLLQSISNIRWIHCRSAGIDFVYSTELANIVNENNIVITNAKGQFSSTLAEYTMGAITYFSKDFNRLKQNQLIKNWEKYSVLEIRGATLGIIGYGDIGKACARLAKVYGMNIIGYKRNVVNVNDDLADEIVNDMNYVFQNSDYIVCALPLTPQTKKLIGKEQFDIAKENLVFINLGRGAVIDEDEMINALQNGKLKGAALDVFATEPLPQSSKLWELDNVLMSPHNMDQTDTFMNEATEFFVIEQLSRFVRGLQLYNHVDFKEGY